MRLIVAILLALAAWAVSHASAIATAGDGASAAGRQADAAAGDGDWRRTVNGWERKSNWEPVEQRRAAPRLPWRVHPLALALLQLLISLAALLAFSRPRDKRLAFIVSNR